MSFSKENKLRVDAVTIAIMVQYGDKQEVAFEIEADNPDALELVKAELENYKIHPSFHYLANLAIEADPEGLNHTMDQIQDWYHRRYIPPFADICSYCEEVKAKHGPSHWCQHFRVKGT